MARRNRLPGAKTAVAAIVATTPDPLGTNTGAGVTDTALSKPTGEGADQIDTVAPAVPIALAGNQPSPGAAEVGLDDLFANPDFVSSIRGTWSDAKRAFIALDPVRLDNVMVELGEWVWLDSDEHAALSAKAIVPDDWDVGIEAQVS